MDAEDIVPRVVREEEKSKKKDKSKKESSMRKTKYVSISGFCTLIEKTV